MGRKNVGLIIDVMNHNLRTGKVNPNLKNVTQAFEVPEHLQADWDKMASKGGKTTAKKATALTKKSTTQKTSVVKKTTGKKTTPNPSSKAAKVSQAPHETGRGRKLTALAVAYAKDNASDLFGDFDGKSDMAADEAIAQTLAEHGQAGENEAFISYERVEAAIEAEFEEIEQDLDDNG
jgi:hypothetical protein